MSGSFKNVTKAGSFKGISEKFTGCFKSVSIVFRKFQGYFGGLRRVSSKYPGSVKVVLSVSMISQNCFKEE